MHEKNDECRMLNEKDRAIELQSFRAAEKEMTIDHGWSTAKDSETELR
jgi:hypothetical protein